MALRSLPNTSDSAEYWEHAFRPRIAAYDALVEQHRGTSVPSESLALVEDELRAMQTQSALFYRRVNALRPVSRLSPELLSLIFHYLSVLEPTVPAEPEVLESREARHKFAPVHTWIKVTHVSCAFRRGALGDRSLWTATTTAFGPKWMELFTERAQVSPRSVHVGVGAPVLLEMKSLLQGARDVQLTKLQPGDSLEKSTIALQEVRSLRIHVKNETARGLFTTPAELSWSTYQPVGNMPHLANLHVYGLVDFELKNPHLGSSLTSLYIGSRRDDPLRHKIKHVLNVLSNLPLLESFTLAHCDLYGDPDGRQIEVPILRYLRLEADTLVDIAKIFSALGLSTGARVHLTAEAPFSGRDTDAWAILGHALSHTIWADLRVLELLSLPEARPELIRHYRPQDEDPFVVSAWRDDEPGYVCVTGQPTSDRRAQLELGITEELRPEPDFCLRLKNYFAGSSRDNIIPTVASLFRVATGLRTLSLRPERMIDSKLPWSEVFARHPRLAAVRLDHEKDFHRLLAALYFIEQPLPVCELKTISFPSRQDRLSFWSTSVDWKNPSNKSKKRSERGALLATVIQRRAAAGVSLANIYLDQVHLQQQALWESLGKGASGDQGEFMQQARQIFKSVEMWNWENWGRGV